MYGGRDGDPGGRSSCAVRAGPAVDGVGRSTTLGPGGAAWVSRRALAFGPMRRAIQPLVDRALPARSRLTLLFTDIVESTQAIVDLGDEQWRDVLDRYRSSVRHELARHRGREVNTAGDAFFAVFDRPMNAVRCAMAMRDGVQRAGPPGSNRACTAARSRCGRAGHRPGGPCRRPGHGHSRGRTRW